MPIDMIQQYNQRRQDNYDPLSSIRAKSHDYDQFFPGVDGPWNSTSACNYWLAEGMQWRAAYKNVPFAVETDSKSGGRRIHVHEYPAREWWDNEDLGRLRQQFDVTAFVFGDQVDQWAEKLFAACTDRERGTLILPARVPVEARCLTIESTWNANALGRMDIAMRFTLESGMPTGTTPTGAIPKSKTMMQGNNKIATNGVVYQARKEFEKEYTSSQPHVGRKEAVKVMNVAAQMVTGINKKARTNPREASEVAFAVTNMIRSAAEMADSQRTVPNTLTNKAGVQSQKLSGVASSTTLTGQGGALRASTQQVLPQVGTYMEGFGGTLEKALDTLMKGSPSPGDFVQALEPMTKLVPVALQQARWAVKTASTDAELALAETVANFCRRMAIAYTAYASGLIAPEKEPEATNARNRLQRALDTEVARAARNVEVHASMRKLKGSVTEFSTWWSQNGGAAKKVTRKTVEPLAVIASDVLLGAARGNRDVEIMKTNGIRHPLHAPAVVAVTGAATGTGVRRGGLSHREFR